MKNVRVFLIQLPAPARTAALAAIRTTFPEAQAIEVGTITEAERHAQDRCSELLLLADNSSAETARATQIMDGNDLPRWAVVILGDEMAELAETVPSEGWQPR